MLGTLLALAASSAPSAAQDGAKPAAAPPAAGAADKIAKGREIFANFACGSCHSLADAGAAGHVGPSFDGDPNLSEPFIIDRVTNGQGAMPAFGGQLSPEEIAAVAAYVSHAAAK